MVKDLEPIKMVSMWQVTNPALPTTQAPSTPVLSRSVDSMTPPGGPVYRSVYLDELLFWNRQM